MVTVKYDPRVRHTQAGINEVYTAQKEIEKMEAAIGKAVKQLVESKQIANKFKSDLSKLDKDKYKNDIKASKDIVKEIDTLIDIYLGKVDKRQGITNSSEVTVEDRLGYANWYVGSRQNCLTNTERNLLQFAEDAVKDALDKTNAFFNDSWKTYQTKMEAIEVNPFKEVETINMD